ncbi:MAG: ABC transporter ATP-binding protein [Clostridia bacterium]|nr:ABC transporter ATP-binding protein [Clostridia bacterium]
MVKPEQSASVLKQGRVEVRDVSKIFMDASGGAIEALTPVTLDVAPGEFVSLVGPSGCGKSTLLRMISGLDVPTSGRLYLDGQEILGPHYERGLMFQDPTLYPWLTVEKNIAIGLEARKLHKKREEVREMIKLVGLEGFEQAFPFQLSGGMAQRAAMARALVNHPRVLLLDEPLGALDAFTRMQMQEELLRIWQDRSTTMLFVTHDIDEAVYLSDRIVVMASRPGRIKEIVPVSMGRPRARNHPDFFRLRTKILEILNFVHDEPSGYQI